MIELISDRTWLDVEEGNEKGSYGFRDLNRVEQAVEQIAGLFPQLGMRLELAVKTDWGAPGDFSAEEWPTREQMARYLANVMGIRQRLCPDLPLPESMDKLTWQGANQIEAALEQAENTAVNIMRTWRYSGELYAGEERVE